MSRVILHNVWLFRINHQLSISLSESHNSFKFHSVIYWGTVFKLNSLEILMSFSVYQHFLNLILKGPQTVHVFAPGIGRVQKHGLSPAS